MNSHYFNDRMNFTKTQLKYFLLAIGLILIVQNDSYAGGFPIRPKKLLLSPSISYFYANKGWDSLRRNMPFDKNGHFRSISYSLYAEYGISRRFAFVALLPYVNNTFEQDDYKKTSTGLTDLETGIRYYLANINYIYYFTVQGTFITPLYKNPDLGYMESGAEIKLSFAGSGHVFGKNYYFTVENGVRRYFGNEGPIQDRYNGSFGLTLDKKFRHQVSIALGGFYSASSFTKFSPNQATNKNFAFNQASLSYGYTFTKRFSMFVTAGTFLNGRNTGDGRSASASFILKPF
jgi:hypothetical protein